MSSVASDAHTWNLIFLQLLLEESGFQVTNLGSCVPDELLIGRVCHDAPDAVVISSVNGHGGAEGLRVIRELRTRPGLQSVPVVIGGKLSVNGVGEDDDRLADRLRSAGFTEVFGQLRDVGELPQFLRSRIDCHRLAAVI